MILRSAKISNFRQLAGENRLVFAQPGGKNVTLILGENGSGKTTLLNAFLWCLYGRVDLERPEDLLSHKAILEAGVGGEIVLEVELVFESHGRTVSMARRRRYRKGEGGSVEQRGKEDFDAVVTDVDGETRPEDDPVTLIRRTLPEDLSKFFFFRGEDAEALAGPSAASKLRQGVESFLELELLDRAIDHLGQVKKEFERDLRNAARGSLKTVTELIEKLESDREDVLVRIREAGHRITALGELEAEIDSELAKFEEIRPKLEEKAQKLQRRTDLVQQRTSARAELARTVSRDGFLAFSDAILTVPSALADQATQRGEIPARIKPQFVDDLISRRECICGRGIDEPAEQQLFEWRKGSGLGYLEEAILHLRGDLRALRGRREAFDVDFHRQRETLSSFDQEIQQLDGQLSRLNAEIGQTDFGLDQIAALQRRRSDSQAKRDSEHLGLGRESRELERLNEQLAVQEAERKRLARESEKEAVLVRRIEAIDHVRDALEELREEWAGVVRDFIDDELKSTWKKIAQLERLIEFTNSFFLSMKERSGEGAWVESAPSSANKRALALAFITALIELAGILAEDASGSTSGVFRGDKYPLVMDAPFATMDAFFKSRVPEGLKRAVPQVVLISSYDQWNGEVSEALGSSLGRAYVLELHKPSSHGEDLHVQIGGNRVAYVVGEEEVLTDWTVINEVTNG